MAPKRNLNKRTAKTKPPLTKASTSQSDRLPVQNIPLQNDSTPTTTYEDELSWCIEQLQLGMTSNKLSAQQVAESQKIMKILMNPKAALVRKRQLMRTYFGDYRKTMELESKKYSLDVNKMKVSPAPTSVTEKSKCLRKHTVKTDVSESVPLKPSESEEKFHFISSDNNFRFNFQDVDE